MIVTIEMHIREIRKSKGLTITQLSSLSGVSVAHISEVETSKQQPTLLILCMLATALEVSIEELFTYSVE